MPHWLIPLLSHAMVAVFFGATGLLIGLGLSDSGPYPDDDCEDFGRHGE